MKHHAPRATTSPHRPTVRLALCLAFLAAFCLAPAPCHSGAAATQSDDHSEPPRRYTGKVDIDGQPVDADMYYFSYKPNMESAPLPDATPEEFAAFDISKAPFPMVWEKEWKTYGDWHDSRPETYLEEIRQGSPTACAMLARYARTDNDRAFWMIQADRLTYPGWSHGAVFALEYVRANYRFGVIDGNSDLRDLKWMASNMVYKGILLGGNLPLVYADTCLKRRSIMVGNKLTMAELGRGLDSNTAVPAGLAGGLRGSAVAWQYLMNAYRRGITSDEKPDMVRACAAAFAGIKIGSELLSSENNEIGLGACEGLAGDFCRSRHLSEEELRQAREQAGQWYEAYVKGRDASLALYRARRARVLPQVRAEVDAWYQDYLAKQQPR